MSPMTFFTAVYISATPFASFALAHPLATGTSIWRLVAPPCAAAPFPIITKVDERNTFVSKDQPFSEAITDLSTTVSVSSVAIASTTSRPPVSLSSSSSPLPLQNTVKSSTAVSVPSMGSSEASLTVSDALPRAATTTSSGVLESGASNATASSNGDCEGDSHVCTGDLTHYDGGLGACGWNVDTSQDMQIALPVGLMGDQSNTNPYCGRQVTIRDPTTQKTVLVTVGDKCMGCQGRAIDLTNAAFAAIGNCDGRCYGYEWWFN